MFFKDLFNTLKLNICEYTFDGHDEVVAYSLSIPFASTLVFGSIMKHQDVFNPNTPAQFGKIINELTTLLKIVNDKDSVEMKLFLNGVRKNLE